MQAAAAGRRRILGLELKQETSALHPVPTPARTDQTGNTRQSALKNVLKTPLQFAICARKYYVVVASHSRKQSACLQSCKRVCRHVITRGI